ncbi:MAG: HD domain-containing protein [Candidatus Falkowbacteria bacterium]|nr:HD domain-containing protein [Candidatus Falkowbacteria bacterium]
MNQEQIILKIIEELKAEFSGEASGHDWWHILRVYNTAKHIAEKEKANMFVVELGALLHDIADWKFHDGDESVGPKKAQAMLERYEVSHEIIDQVCDIILNVSFKGAAATNGIKTLEGKIVQDADRLDAIGALGIARTFAYGGFMKREMYNPETEAEANQSKESYCSKQSTTINHFYEKLLLLKDRMNTVSGREMASARHEFMEKYLEHFYKEWEGEM